MTYTDYDFYCAEYAGCAIPFDAFAKFSLRASERIDCDTHARAACFFESDENAAQREALSRCTCAVADILYAQEECAHAMTNGVASESLGNWSRTYRTNSEAATGALIYAAEKLYLGDSGLLYRGRARNV